MLANLSKLCYVGPIETGVLDIDTVSVLELHISTLTKIIRLHKHQPHFSNFNEWEKNLTETLFHNHLETKDLFVV